MKRKNAVTLVLLGISLMIWINLTSADEEVEFYARTDKAYYGYGDQGTLFITVQNNEPGPISVKSIKVHFPWHGWYHEQWSGNYTKDIPTEEQTVNDNATKTYTLQFTVPSESRDVWKDSLARVWVTYVYGDATIPSDLITIPINVAIPVYNENITPIYYLTAVLTTAVIIVIIELYFVWKRLGKLTSALTTA